LFAVLGKTIKAMSNEDEMVKRFGRSSNRPWNVLGIIGIYENYENSSNMKKVLEFGGSCSNKVFNFNLSIQS